jgi:hypothetical protein
MTIIKTGMVYQRTAKGPNYLALGKTTINGETMVISVKNGNVNKNGDARSMAKAAGGVVIFAHSPDDIARVHQLRDVNVSTIFTKGEADTTVQRDLKRMLTKGINSAAELPSLAELR